MNLLLLQPSQLINAEFAELSPRQITHLTNIIKAQHGQTLKIGIVGGNIGRGTLDTSSATWRIAITALDTPAPPRLPVTLILALPRPQMIKRIMQTVATMGVDCVYLVETERVEKNYWQSPKVTSESLHQYLLLGAEQGIDTRLPRVIKVKYFKEFVQSTLPQLREQKISLFAHPQANQSAPPLDTQRASVVAIGPEGGFTEDEVALFEAEGFAGFSLGERILKVETAVPVILTHLYPPSASASHSH
ncbi:MAG: 16S rRNA (uracil(1498)-N(3))-methyltransferase [Cellvibrionaceae bacterium]|nr:16S rRNA (uracil(1498)-N(3))-methyltransferase [Cellvibrionaceae bacterium]